jgi:acyl dehydratase
MGDIKTVKRDTLFFDDVREGDEIPKLVKQYTLQKIAVFASVHGDWCPGHYDHKWAHEKFRQPAPFAYGLQITAHCSQVLTDWMGPYGALKRFKSRTLTPVYPQDTLTIMGRVIKKYLNRDEGCIECDVWAEKQDGKLAARASGIVLLPIRVAQSQESAAMNEGRQT